MKPYPPCSSRVWGSWSLGEQVCGYGRCLDYSGGVLCGPASLVVVLMRCDGCCIGSFLLCSLFLCFSLLFFLILLSSILPFHHVLPPTTPSFLHPPCVCWLLYLLLGLILHPSNPSNPLHQIFLISGCIHTSILTSNQTNEKPDRHPLQSSSLRGWRWTTSATRH